MVIHQRWTAGAGQVLLRSEKPARLEHEVTAEVAEEVAEGRDQRGLTSRYPNAGYGERGGTRFFGAVPRINKIIFAAPTMGLCAMEYLRRGYMIPFYTDDYPQASLSVIALFRIVMVLCDMSWDPIFANWTDGFKSRWGRRRPFLLAAGVINSISIVAAFAPPDAGPLLTGVWFGIFSLIFKVVGWSMDRICFEAMVAEITPDYMERTSIWSYSELALVCGVLLGSSIPALVKFGPDCTQSPCTGCHLYMVLAGGFAVLYLLPQLLMVSVFRQKPRSAQSTKHHESIIQTIVASICNRPFRCLVVSDIVEGVGSTLPLIVMPYVARWIVGWKELEEAGFSVPIFYAILGALHLVTRLPFTCIWRAIANRFGKVNTFIAFTFLYSIQMLLFMLVNRGSIVMAMVLAVTWGMVYGGHWLLRDIMSSVIDYDEFLTGQRREGQYYMILELIPKMMEIPMEAFPFLLMAYFGYSATDQTIQNACSVDTGDVTSYVVERQSLGVEWTLRACFSLLPGVFGVLSGFILLKFPFRTKEQHDRILEGIVMHNSGLVARDPFTGVEVPAVRYEEDGSVSIGEERLDKAVFTGLAHFFPGELRRAVVAHDLRVIEIRLRIWIALELWLKSFSVKAAGRQIAPSVAQAIPDLGVGMGSTGSMDVEAEVSASPTTGEDNNSWTRSRSVSKLPSNESCVVIDPDDDPYEPTKSEYLIPASADEIAAANDVLLEQQIHHLETTLLHRTQDEKMGLASEAAVPDSNHEADILSHYRDLLMAARCEHNDDSADADAAIEHVRSMTHSRPSAARGVLRRRSGCVGQSSIASCTMTVACEQQIQKRRRCM